MEQIRNCQHLSRRVQHLWRISLGRDQLKQRVDRYKWNSGLVIDLTLANLREDLFHDAVGSFVAIVVRIF